jgi:hypothetical protein
MARDEMARKSDQDKSLLDRRSYLRLAGTAAASVAAFGAGASANTSSDDLLLQEDFESGDYEQNYTGAWRQGEYDGTTSQIAKDGSSCLEVNIPAGNHYGMDAKYDPADAGDVDSPPQQLYQSYWVRFSESFHDAQDPRGKLPGIAMTETGAGYGSKFDGVSWSARGGFDWNDGGVQLRYYIYNLDTDGQYGHQYFGPVVAPGEWHHIEQEAVLNTTSGGSANADGELRMWVNGQLAIDKLGVRFTTEPERGCNAWFDIYHGGSDPASTDISLFFDDWKVATARPSGGSDDSSTTEETTDSDEQPEGEVLELVAGPDTSNVSYEFTVEGSVQKRTSAGDNSAESNDTVTDNGDGTVTVSGVAGEGYGDSYSVNGIITSMELDESKWTIRYDGSEVSVQDIAFPNTLVIDGSNAPRRASTYTFRVSGSARKSSDLGSINSYDIVSEGEISGRVVGGKDGYRFSGEVTGFSLDGPANVRVEDGA